MYGHHTSITGMLAQRNTSGSGLPVDLASVHGLANEMIPLFSIMANALQSRRTLLGPESSARFLCGGRLRSIRGLKRTQDLVDDKCNS